MLDRDLLSRFDYTADPWNSSQTYAYLSDVPIFGSADGRMASSVDLRPATRSTARHGWSASWRRSDRGFILLLGRYAAPFFLRRFAGVAVRRLGDLVARAFPVRVGSLEATAVATLHPSGAQMARGGSATAYEPTARLVADLLAQ